MVYIGVPLFWGPTILGLLQGPRKKLQVKHDLLGGPSPFEAPTEDDMLWGSLGFKVVQARVMV